VGDVQAIEKEGDKRAKKRLTRGIGGVDSHSFFDTFLSFAGWCGVRGSSEVTFRNSAKRRGKRASKGL
jgi:hypothetical protein